MDLVASLSGNDYRKRVLAPIEARGGMDATDPFEVYDLPLESAAELSDAQVAARLEQVWALWQKQRDHPKYRGLVIALLESHEHSCQQLATAHGRQELAKRAVAFREQRDGERFAQLDAAVRRLVDRFGGLPRGKVEGLRALAVHSGIGVEDFEGRIRRYRLIDDAPAAPAAAVADLSGVYRQIRADLDELGQLDSEPAPASLYALIGLPAGAAPQRVRAQRDALAVRNRERRPDRRRALVDDLLAAVTSLLVEGDPQAYLAALVADVTVMLRPRVAAAILIEDALTIADHEVLLAAAEEAGLDRPRAVQVLADLAREHGVSAPEALTPAVPPATSATTTGPPSSPSSPQSQSQPPAAPVSSAAWQQELTRARAALRSGLLLSAQRHVQAARSSAGQMLPPIRALDDEVGRRIAEAKDAWRAVERSLSSSLLDQAAAQLESLVSGASEILSPAGEAAAAVLARVRDDLAHIDSALSAAAALTGDARERALLSLAVGASGHPAVLAALTSIPPAAPMGVTARRVSGGVVVSWRASGSIGEIAYRVLRREGDGTAKALGSTAALSFETSSPDGPLPEFVVVARRAGIESPPASTSGSPLPPSPAGAAPAVLGLAEPVATLEIAPYRGRLRLIYPLPVAGRVEVVRLAAGTTAPAAGTAVPDVAGLGVILAAMTPGLALDARPTQALTAYLAVTVADGRIPVAGASASFVAIPAVSGLSVAADRLTWTWPNGCTEAVIVWRRDAPPSGPADPDAERRKLTITRHDIDGGLLLPASRPLHVAIFGAARVDGQLVTDPTAHPSAALTLS